MFVEDSWSIIASYISEHTATEKVQDSNGELLVLEIRSLRRITLFRKSFVCLARVLAAEWHLPSSTGHN
jgi:hypothetical protein